MTDRLCAEGHVVEVGRETCSRCNGPVVSKEVDLSDKQENTMNDEQNQSNESEQKHDEGQSQDSQSTEGTGATGDQQQDNGGEANQG